MKKFYFFLLCVALCQLVFSQTYHQLSSKPFIENWDNPALISANDNWSGYPSIRGYLGQDITTSTGTNPQTLTGVSASATDLDVIANQNRPATNGTGGVAEFDGIINRTIAFQGSGTADAPHIIIYLNTIGVNNVRVRYNLRDIDSSADNSVQAVALQYRIGNTGNFIDIPAAFVADASSGPGLGELVTAVDISLPEAAVNKEEVQLRIMTTNAGGNDEWIGVDDININASKAVNVVFSANATEAGTPGAFTVTFTPATSGITSFDYAFPNLAAGTATFGTDYTVTLTIGEQTTNLATMEGTISVPASTSSLSFNIIPTDDATVEGTEHIQLIISNPSEGYSVATSNSSINLTDNDAAPTVTVSAMALAAEPSASGSFRINLSAPAPASGVTVSYSFGGQAEVVNDYRDTLNGIITIPAGDTSALIYIIPADDSLAEGKETVSILLNTASAGYVIMGSSATINILDNDYPPVVINEIYGGGGNSGATYRNDFIELYNNSASPVSLNGWSIQYASATGGNWQKTDLSDTIPAFGYYLIQQAAGSGGTADLPQPDARGSISMAAAAGKVALVGNTISLTGTCPVNPAIVDLVGFGTTANCYEGSAPTPAPSNSTSITRTNGADSDNNNVDLTVLQTPTPKNSIPDTVPPGIRSLYPANEATGSGTAFTASLQFDELVKKGEGFIVMKNATGEIVKTYDIASEEVVVIGSTASFLVQSLAFNTGYYFEIQEGSILDMEGNRFAGMSGNNGWHFTTTSQPLGVIGQTYDFTGCTPALSQGFSFYSVAGPQLWACTDFGIDAAKTPTGSAPTGLQINGFAGTNIQNEDWLISPSFDLSTTTYPLLSFYSRTRFNGPPLQLMVSLDYPGTGDPRNYSWTTVNGRFPAQTTDVWTLSSNINLAAFKGSNVHFAFVYHSSEDDGARWTLDDITLVNSATAPPPTLTVSASDMQFGYVAAGSSNDKTFSFTANDLVEPVTLTSTGDFLLSKDGTSFQSSISYDTAGTNNIPQTVYVRFHPSASNQNFAGTVVLTTSGITDSVFLTGTSIDPNTTLEVVNWNIEWFGSPGFGPTNNDQQEQNVKTILQDVGADIYGLVEVVDESRLARVVSQMNGYSYVIGHFGSHVNPPDPTGGPASEAQKLAFVYKTSVFSNVIARPFINNQNTASTSYNNWSSGRYPFLMTADVTLNCVTKRISFILIHAKANTSPTATSYARRQAAAVELHDSLDTYFADANVILLGDFNDDLDRTITDGINPPVSSYKIFTDDSTHYFAPTLSLSEAGKKSTVSYNDVIDHVMITDDLQPYYMAGTATILTDAANMVNNYGSTTSDHYPVFTRYQFEQPAAPVVTNCPVFTPVCATDAGVYQVPAFTVSGSCDIISYHYVITGATERSGASNDASGNFNPGTSVISWTATDGAGQTISCQTTVIVNSRPIATIPDAFALPAGTLANTVYKGYAPASTLNLESAVTSGVAGYNYSWSPATGNTASVTVNPDQATTYRVIVTDANGCSDTAYKAINVIDVRAGKRLDKVAICHNGKSLEVGVTGVADHLAHGDMLGRCKPGGEGGKEKVGLKLKVLSNPTVSQFTITAESTNKQLVFLTVIDGAGRFVELKSMPANGTIQLGNKYRPGVYYLFVNQGKEFAIIKLVKQ